MLVLCEFCRDMVKYSTKDVPKVTVIRGKQYHYVGKEANCEECKSEIFVPNIHDYNLEQLDHAYRQQEQLVTISEIREVLEKYKIGKRPLSLLLGWGEVTLTRYVNGDIPTKQYSDILKRLGRDQCFMLDILERNKDLITQKAYRVSKEAIAKLQENDDIPSTQTTKIEEVANYLLYKNDDITPLALQKLLYYAQGFCKVFTGTYLFEDDCEVGSHGPVYRVIFNKYKVYQYDNLEVNYDSTNQLTQIEKEILDCVINTLGCYSGKSLEKMILFDLPREVAHLELEDNDPGKPIMEKEEIDNCFNTMKQAYNLVTISDIKKYGIKASENINNSML
ncbi:type II toxin-antitoxin system antitoxin SocA domain-containing protein [Bacillus cereus group sp. BceL212]|uniref:type II toxin-antitoxin system antitoxin SocA domain-containing protein n=1 Tax=Bacillus cereus group sp. BceL212 TaxID=3445018 RepID=UPI003F1EA749